jgi:hypothetical protein
MLACRCIGIASVSRGTNFIIDLVARPVSDRGGGGRGAAELQSPDSPRVTCNILISERQNRRLLAIGAEQISLGSRRVDGHDLDKSIDVNDVTVAVISNW